MSSNESRPRARRSNDRVDGVSSNVSRGDVVSDAPNEEREAAAVATLGARVPPEIGFQDAKDER
jgi:hypothetical protein